MSTTVNSEQLRELGIKELGEIEPDSLVDLILVRKESPGGQLSGVYEVMENDGPSLTFSSLLENSDTMPKVFTFINKDDCLDATNCLFRFGDIDRLVEEPTPAETHALFYATMGVFTFFVLVMFIVYICFFCKARPDYSPHDLTLPPRETSTRAPNKRDNVVAVEVEPPDVGSAS